MWQVTGHERAVHLLRNSIDSGRVSHAYLFSGPRHVGKVTLALELARALNCQETGAPCGHCLSCRKVEKGVHPDVQLLALEEGSKNIGIDAVRKLQESVALRPAEGRKKVYIIEEAERLSEAAANCLLKTLEEPPPSVVMVLTTQDATMLLPTIVSRCQRIDLGPVPVAEIESALVGHRGLQPEQARTLAALARGGIGWALRVASNPKALERRGEQMDKLISLSRAGRVARLGYAAELATLYGRDPEAARGALEMWQSWWRDLLLTRLGLARMVVNVDQGERLEAEALRHSVETLGRMVMAIQDTISMLAQNVNARLALEVLMLRLPRPIDRYR